MLIDFRRVLKKQMKISSQGTRDIPRKPSFHASKSSGRPVDFSDSDREESEYETDGEDDAPGRVEEPEQEYEEEGEEDDERDEEAEVNEVSDVDEEAEVWLGISILEVSLIMKYKGKGRKAPILGSYKKDFRLAQTLQAE